MLQGVAPKAYRQELAYAQTDIGAGLAMVLKDVIAEACCYATLLGIAWRHSAQGATGAEPLHVCICVLQHLACLSVQLSPASDSELPAATGMVAPHRGEAPPSPNAASSVQMPIWRLWSDGKPAI